MTVNKQVRFQQLQYAFLANKATVVFKDDDGDEIRFQMRAFDGHYWSDMENAFVFCFENIESNKPLQFSDDIFEGIIRANELTLRTLDSSNEYMCKVKCGNSTATLRIKKSENLVTFRVSLVSTTKD